MVVLVHLLQDTERTIIPYLNKEETLEGLLNDGYRTWKNKLTNHFETRGKIEIKILVLDGDFYSRLFCLQNEA